MPFGEAIEVGIRWSKSVGEIKPKTLIPQPLSPEREKGVKIASQTSLETLHTQPSLKEGWVCSLLPQPGRKLGILHLIPPGY